MLLYTHNACISHLPGPRHPESPDRLRTVLNALAHDRFARLDRIDAPRATREQLARVHEARMIDHVFATAPEHDFAFLDADTCMSPDSLEAALRAAGAVCAAVGAVLDGKSDRAFCAVRPPGHHATPGQSMGFCIFNNVAAGAALALERGIERVAIVDFDVHHGNGTQDIFCAEPRVLYVSTHQWPLYPNTGAASETGVGNVVNVPLPPQTGSRQFRNACREIALPALDAFRPQLVMISAGFDAHHLDPLANLELDGPDFEWITLELADIARRHAGNRIVSSLEGGYNLTALRQSVPLHVAALME